MEQNIKEKEKVVHSFYDEFKTNKKITKFIYENNAIKSIDEKRDEVYYSEDSYYDVSKKGKYVNKDYGDISYGLRVRLKDDEGIEIIKSILSESEYNPQKVITNISERMAYTEVTIEFFNPLKIIK